MFYDVKSLHAKFNVLRHLKTLNEPLAPPCGAGLQLHPAPSQRYDAVFYVINTRHTSKESSSNNGKNSF